MKSFKRGTLTVALVASLVGVSSASAAVWDPPGTSVTASQVGSSTLNFGASVTCAAGDASLTASGDLFTLTGTTDPLTIAVCSNSVSPSLTTTVTTTGTWTLTATSTTSIDFNAVSSSGAVLDITMGTPPFFGCSITVPSPLHISGNTWSNSTHRLTLNSAASFSVSHTGICPGINATGTLTATFQLPSAVVVT